jgi:hypothetical protein
VRRREKTHVKAAFSRKFGVSEYMPQQIGSFARDSATRHELDVFSAASL